MTEHKRILLVDDDRGVLFVLKSALLRLENGFRVDTAESGNGALERAHEATPDLLMTDIILSGMNGIELTEAIKDLNPDLITIWVTAYGCDRVRDEADRLGVFCCMEKPLALGDIRRAAAEALEGAAEADT